MEELTNILKMQDITVSAMNAYNRLLKAHVLAIDDIMLFSINKAQAVAFFNMINHLHEQASIIIIKNKSPKQWAETLEDELLATALLDRLLYRCEVVKLKGASYRMENRKTIFPEKTQEIKQVKCLYFLVESGELLLLKIDESKFAIYIWFACSC